MCHQLASELKSAGAAKYAEGARNRRFSLRGLVPLVTLAGKLLLLPTLRARVDRTGLLRLQMLSDVYEQLSREGHVIFIKNKMKSYFCFVKALEFTFMTDEILVKKVRGAQCPRIDLNKRFLPRPITTTA